MSRKYYTFRINHEDHLFDDELYYNNNCPISDSTLIRIEHKNLDLNIARFPSELSETFVFSDKNKELVSLLINNKAKVFQFIPTTLQLEDDYIICSDANNNVIKFHKTYYAQRLQIHVSQNDEELLMFETLDTVKFKSASKKSVKLIKTQEANLDGSHPEEFNRIIKRNKRSARISKIATSILLIIVIILAIYFIRNA